MKLSKQKKPKPQLIKQNLEVLHKSDLWELHSGEKEELDRLSKISLIDNSSHIVGDPILALKFFDELWPYAYKRYHKIPFLTRIMRNLVRGGIINTGILLECAISRTGLLERDSTHGRDFIDLSDAKTSSVRFRSTAGKPIYSSHISGTSNKQGALRVLIYERILDKFYYFLIPHTNHINCSYVEIPFHNNGQPARDKQLWWKFEVPKFKDMCIPMPVILPSSS